MSTVYDFHMDFQFWANLTTLRGLQMVWYPRNTRSDPAQTRVKQIEFFLSWGQDFEYMHPLKYAGIKKLKKWAKKTHPTGHPSSATNIVSKNCSMTHKGH